MSSSGVSRIICLRHAEAVVNVEGRLSSAIPGTPLTARGRDQASGVAEMLKDRSAAQLYSSPVGRAQQTAEIVSDALGLRMTIVDGLHEVGMGAREETPGTNADFFLHASFQSWMHGTDLDLTFEGGESGRQVVDRMRSSLDAIADQHVGETALVVSHGGCLVAGLLHICDNLDYEDVSAGVPGNGASIELERRDGRWTCLDWPRSTPS